MRKYIYLARYRKVGEPERVSSHVRLFAGQIVLCNACATILYVGQADPSEHYDCDAKEWRE
jgi:hypothetical protein